MNNVLHFPPPEHEAPEVKTCKECGGDWFIARVQIAAGVIATVGAYSWPVLCAECGAAS